MSISCRYCFLPLSFLFISYISILNTNLCLFTSPPFLLYISKEMVTTLWVSFFLFFFVLFYLLIFFSLLIPPPVYLKADPNPYTGAYNAMYGMNMNAYNTALYQQATQSAGSKREGGCIDQIFRIQLLFVCFVF